jgi:hypothetical protein
MSGPQVGHRPIAGAVVDGDQLPRGTGLRR